MKRQAKDLTGSERLRIVKALQHRPFGEIRDVTIAEQAHKLGVHQDTVRLVALEDGKRC